MTVVADASPLIALAQVGHLPLLERLFGEVVAPPAVVREVGLSLPGFIRERKLSQPIQSRRARPGVWGKTPRRGQVGAEAIVA